MPRYSQADSRGLGEPGHQCAHCGRPGFMHEKRKVYPDDAPPGRYKYEYWCPGTRPTEATA